MLPGYPGEDCQLPTATVAGEPTLAGGWRPGAYLHRRFLSCWLAGMKIGIQLPEIEREVRWPEVREMILLIEEAGFDSIWVGDHLLYRAPHIGVAGPWEAWTQMAAIAALTERVEFGPLVASTSFHSPAMLAKKAATLDEISGGRLILGLGAGWNETEYRAFGFPFDRRVSRFEEAFTIIRTLLRDRGDRLRRRLLHDPRLRHSPSRAPAGRAAAHDRVTGAADARHHGAAHERLECLARLVWERPGSARTHHRPAR